MGATKQPRRWLVPLALAGVVVPPLALPLSLGLALWARALGRRDARLEPVARGLVALAAVDLLVLVGFVASSAAQPAGRDAPAHAEPGAPSEAPAPAARPRIGVVLDPDDPGGGARVVAVVPDSPAERAGLREGDVVTRVDRQPVERNADVVRGLAAGPAEAHALVVEHGGERSEVVLVPETLRLPEALPPERTPGRISLFRDLGTDVRLGGFTQWLVVRFALMAALGAALAYLADRRRRVPDGPGPRAIALGFAASWLAMDLTLVASHGLFGLALGTTLGGALLSTAAAAGALCAVAFTWRRRLGWRGEPGGAPVAPTLALAVPCVVAGVARAAFVARGLELVLHLRAPDFGSDFIAVLPYLDPFGVALLGLAAVVLAPIGEEWLYRGILLPWLARRVRPEWAVVLSAALFGLGHLQYGPQLLVIVAYGLVFGWARVRTGGLAAPVALHMLVNAAVLGIA
ncbi:MAG: CPBP family intramembrane metalloprotease, partial [Polyangiaceae bacterium]|nr:CPBP family intramembrane metalloprotease [Polyangiaceae bacterium]